MHRVNQLFWGETMDLKSVFTILSSIFVVLFYVPYVLAIISGEAKPTLSTWISWFLMDSAIFAGMIAANDIAYQMVAYIAGTTLVLGLSAYRRASLGWKTLDTVCVFIVVLAVGLWVYTGDPNLAIIFSLVAIVVGTVPMLSNLIKDPTVEPMLPWILVSIGGTFGLLAIPSWTIAGALTQIVFFLLQSVVLALMLRRFMGKKARTQHGEGI